VVCAAIFSFKMLDPYRYASLKKIKNQPLNISHPQVMEITEVQKSTTAPLIQQLEKLRDE
jgi:hypothetical protein